VETYDIRIDSHYVWTDVAGDGRSAEVHVELDVANVTDTTEAAVCILDPTNQAVSEASVPLRGESKIASSLRVDSPQLWWPNGHGSQPLYTAKIVISSSGKPAVEKSVRFGIRTINVIQRPLTNAPGKTFMFNVNGRDIFCQGGDWIPTDNLIPRIGRKGYFAWIEMARRSNLNMLRVWGGGIYETEDFWDACDEMGMLVWYDYAFACDETPIYAEMLSSIEAEAEAQTKRMRSRASLALLCGGNEQYMIADAFGKKYDHHDLTGPFEKSEFPQRKIFQEVIPRVAEKHGVHSQYWPNSPWGGSPANDVTIGDVHQWSVWHLEQLSYQDYKKLTGRFVSEFGMHGFPDMRTVRVFCPDPAEQYPQSKTIDCHNKGHGAETRIARYLSENFRYDNANLANFAFCSQVLQSEALGYALRDWKRDFNGPGDERCAGAVIWQLNDCYPVTSWAYVDSFRRPKPAFYMVKRCFAPVSVGLARDPRSRWVDDDAIRDSEIPIFEAFAHNTTTEALDDVTLQVEAWDFASQAPIAYPEARRKVHLRAGCNTELGKIPNPDSLPETALVVLRASIVDAAGKTLARVVDWPEPFRYLVWPKDTKVTAEVIDSADPAWEKQVKLSTNYPVKACFVEVVYNEDDGLEDPIWEDNMLDLMPDEVLTVGVSGLHGRELSWRFLNDWEM
jgi:beta-mannosidase